MQARIATPGVALRRSDARHTAMANVVRRSCCQRYWPIACPLCCCRLSRVCTLPLASLVCLSKLSTKRICRRTLSTPRALAHYAQRDCSMTLVTRHCAKSVSPLESGRRRRHFSPVAGALPEQHPRRDPPSPPPRHRTSPPAADLYGERRQRKNVTSKTIRHSTYAAPCSIWRTLASLIS